MAFLALFVVAFAAGLSRELWRVKTVAAADVADDASMLVVSGSATCAYDLRARVGSTVDCTVVGAATPSFVVRATVTTVEGHDVAYEFHQVG